MPAVMSRLPCLTDEGQGAVGCANALRSRLADTTSNAGCGGSRPDRLRWNEGEQERRTQGEMVAGGREGRGITVAGREETRCEENKRSFL